MGWTHAVLMLAGLAGPHDVGPTATLRAERATGSAAYVSASGIAAIGFSGPGDAIAAPHPHAWPSASLKVPGLARTFIGGMWRASPTFRRQCARLAEAGAVVTLTFDVPARGAPSAWSEITRRAGIRADIHLRSADARMVELLAHEMEHVLEQLDGVDVPLAADRLHGAAAVGQHRTFETSRAIAVGAIVAREVAESRRRR